MLRVVTLTYRPIELIELPSLVEDPFLFPSNEATLLQIIGLCGSFLTVKDDAIYFVHQLSKDFLTSGGDFSRKLYPDGTSYGRRAIAEQAINAISKVLREDIYELLKPGIYIHNITVPDNDPWRAVKYACIHWTSHIKDAMRNATGCKAQSYLEDEGLIHGLFKQHFLPWIESLSLLGSGYASIKFTPQLAEVAETL